MKKILLCITILILALSSANLYAQMGHGMMRGGEMMGEEHMRGMMQEGRMMDHSEMMNRMTGMTDEITGMMQDVTGIMRQSGPEDKDRIYMLAEMMRDLASEMNRISFMIEKEGVSEQEVRDLEMRIRQLKERMKRLRR